MGSETFLNLFIWLCKFVARTYHRALAYLKVFSDNIARLMRWSLQLAELEFGIEYKPEKIHSARGCVE